jgi:hypothetical protein
MSKGKDKGGGSKKYGRNKKSPDAATSLYVRGKISYETYRKMKNI